MKLSKGMIITLILVMNLNRRVAECLDRERMRIRYGKTIWKWFDYLFVSPKEMEVIVADTTWRIKEFLGGEDPNNFAVIGKTLEAAVVRGWL